KIAFEPVILTSRIATGEPDAPLGAPPPVGVVGTVPGAVVVPVPLTVVVPPVAVPVAAVLSTASGLNGSFASGRLLLPGSFVPALAPDPPPFAALPPVAPAPEVPVEPPAAGDVSVCGVPRGTAPAVVPPELPP